MDISKVIFVTKGKDSLTIQAFKEHLVRHKGCVENVKEFSCDLSPAFISGIEEYFPSAHITFDRFHVMKLLNEAVDDVRRNEQKQEKDLKSSRYVWLKNPQNLSEKEKKKLAALSSRKLKTGRAYRMKLVFQEQFTHDEATALEELKNGTGRRHTHD